MKVRYKPGMQGVEKQDWEEWQKWAGFVKLRWDEFLQQHKKVNRGSVVDFSI